MHLVTAEVFAHVVQVIGIKSGSGLFLREKSGLFLATAKHIAGEGSEVELLLRWNPAAAPQEVRLKAFPCMPEVYLGDVAVFQLPEHLYTRSDLSAPACTSQGLEVSAQVFALGYPGVLISPDNTSWQSLPLVRAGTMAGLRSSSIDRPHHTDYVFDMSSSPGASGGPVFWRTPRDDWAVAAIIISEFTLELDALPSNPAEAKQASGYSRAIPIERILHMISVPGQIAEILT